eukprot:scaffold846_cov336-Pavlova_lutheri.AAC.8
MEKGKETSERKGGPAHGTRGSIGVALPFGEPEIEGRSGDGRGTASREGPEEVRRRKGTGREAQHRTHRRIGAPGSCLPPRQEDGGVQWGTDTTAMDWEPSIPRPDVSPPRAGGAPPMSIPGPFNPLGRVGSRSMEGENHPGQGRLACQGRAGPFPMPCPGGTHAHRRARRNAQLPALTNPS